MLSQLFLAALRCSGVDAPASTAGGVARALLDYGVVGCDAHRRRHPLVPLRPPYDELRCASEMPFEAWERCRLQYSLSTSKKRLQQTPLQ